jgi:phosphate transport system permease protein
MTGARMREIAAHLLLGLATLATLVPLFLLLGVLVVRGAPALSLAFLTEAPRDGLRAGGIFPAIVGTFLLCVGTGLLSLPLGVAAAIYLREYAPDNRVTRGLRLATLNLAGVPSIVHGLFGLGVFVVLLGMGCSLAAGCCTLAVLVLPTVIVASEEALASVPDSLREASEGLGATRRQTILRVVLPAALPGILTGTILAVGRAAGETAPILLTCAVFYQRSLPTSPGEPVMALPYHLYVIATQVPNVPPGLPYATALVLVALVLATSAVAIVLRARFRGRSLS